MTTTEEWNPGDRATWTRIIRGFENEPPKLIPAIIKSIGPKKVTIWIAQANFGKAPWIKVTRSVDPKNLTKREAPCAELGEE